MRVLSVCLALVLGACGASSSGPTVGGGTPGLDRLRFNQLALRLDLPIFWASDANQNGTPDPDEIHALRFYGIDARWTEAGHFTPDFDIAMRRIRAEHEAAIPSDPRIAAVVSELDHAAPTLVSTDLSTLTPPHRAFAQRMLAVGALIDQLYARQVGMDALASGLPEDRPSRSLFRRNWGASCRSSAEESNPACSAIVGAPDQPVDVYPAAMQANDGFCATIEGRPDAAELTSPFTVVRDPSGSAFSGSDTSLVRMMVAPPLFAPLVAVPYSVAYADLMGPIATELRAAADAMTDPAETALVAYLRAAATSFETNDWPPADEAWAAMNARNSAWYVRVGPDETYWEPCSQKAGFHLTFARINPGLARLAGPPHAHAVRHGALPRGALLEASTRRARSVFHMPDFIDIVVNAGDDRDAFGATIGQSLPNWGPVADEGRGRTVAMSNLYTDEDSLARRRAQAASLFDAPAMTELRGRPGAGLLSTILHEASHNLGPSHDFRLNGLTADEAFGGGLASMLEELKAQSGALFFVEFLRSARGHRRRDRAAHLRGRDRVGHGPRLPRHVDAPGNRKAYSQLAAIQLGFLIDQGALRWDPEAMAADGVHRGALSIDLSRMPAASTALMEAVMRIKATADRDAAVALADRYVGAAPDADLSATVVPHATIVERWSGGFPQTTFVFEILE
jgi:hypothetical protein